MSHDTEEAKLCLRQLNCRAMHHEVVKQALRLALEEKAHSSALLALLCQLSTEGYMSDDQLLKVSILSICQQQIMSGSALSTEEKPAQRPQIKVRISSEMFYSTRPGGLQTK